MLRSLGSVLVVSALVLWSCGDDDDDTTEVGKAIQATPEELRGRWVSNCEENSTLELARLQREYVFNAIGDFDKIERYYLDDNCSQLAASYKVIGTVQDKGKFQGNRDISTLNFTLNDATLKIESPDVVETFNRLQLCGKTDWKVGEDVKIIGVDCLGYNTRKGDVLFDIYDVREGKLYFGRTNVFLSPDDSDARPTELNTNVVFSKQ